MAAFAGNLIKIDQGFHSLTLEIEIFKLAPLRAVVGFKPVIQKGLGGIGCALITRINPRGYSLADFWYGLNLYST